jgi:hypothetical protein
VKKGVFAGTHNPSLLVRILVKKFRRFLCSPCPIGPQSPATTLVEVAWSLKIPTDMAQMTLVDFKAVPKNSTIYPGDRASLFPKEYPVFVDWKDLRF